MNNDRGVSFGKKQVEVRPAEFTHSWAYVIGINAYQNGIARLHTAEALFRALGGDGNRRAKQSPDTGTLPFEKA